MTVSPPSRAQARTGPGRPTALFPRVPGQTPRLVVHGDGVYLYDEAGRRYLDGAAGAAVCALGHGHPELLRAIEGQLHELAYAHGLTFATPALLAAAERLARTAPGGGPWRAYFVSGGSEAVETALKIARQLALARGEGTRFKVLTRRVAYHGATLGALALSGQPARRRAFAPLMPPIAAKVAPAYCYRCPFGRTPDRCALECAQDLERAVLEEGPENVLAFLAEPVSGSSAPGAHPPDDYWRVVREICNRHGLLLIADEVMSGLGRTGRWWAIEHGRVVPDLIVTAKGLGAGYVPVGAVLVPEALYRELVEAEPPEGPGFVHGFTFGGHPVAAAAAAATLEIVERDGLVRRAAELGDRLLRGLREALGAHPHVGRIEGRGLLLGIEFVRDRRTKEPFPVTARVRQRVAEAALERGLYVYPGGGSADGVRGDHVLIAPPLVIAPEQLDELVEKLKAAVEAALGASTGTG